MQVAALLLAGALLQAGAAPRPAPPPPPEPIKLDGYAWMKANTLNAALERALSESYTLQQRTLQEKIRDQEKVVQDEYEKLQKTCTAASGTLSISATYDPVCTRKEK